MSLPNNRGNRNTTDNDVSQMFREQGQAQPGGYTREDGGSESVKGDSDAAFVKEPPFVTDALVLVDSFPPTLAGAVGAEYDILSEIQCRQFRLLQLYIAYTMAVGGRLSIIPEAQANGVWYAETLVGGVVTPLAPVGTRFAAGGFGSRALEGTELRTDVLVAGTARFTLTFDVSALDAFRLNVLELTANAGNLLQVQYALSV